MNMTKGKCYIIAEIGGNFTTYEQAILMIDQAARAGADAVKLQTYRADTMASKDAMFDMEEIKGSQYDYFKKFEISEELHAKIYEYAKNKGLDIFSTPSHITDVDMLERLHTDVYKIGADDITNLPLLTYVAKLGKKMMISSGMSDMDDVRQAVATIKEAGNTDLVLMHTVSMYPTRDEFVNLNVIKTFQKEFPDLTIGYSDHTLGVDSCIYAACMGAEVVEKHFTYDKNADGPDHVLSATEDELARMVRAIRQFETMRGDGIKRPQGIEAENQRNSRKSVTAIRPIKAGEVFTTENIDLRRPGYGIQPKDYEAILGKKAKRDLPVDAMLSWDDIEK